MSWCRVSAKVVGLLAAFSLAGTASAQTIVPVPEVTTEIAIVNSVPLSGKGDLVALSATVVDGEDSTEFTAGQAGMGVVGDAWATSLSDAPAGVDAWSRYSVQRVGDRIIATVRQYAEADGAAVDVESSGKVYLQFRLHPADVSVTSTTLYVTVYEYAERTGDLTGGAKFGGVEMLGTTPYANVKQYTRQVTFSGGDPEDVDDLTIEVDMALAIPAGGHGTLTGTSIIDVSTPCLGPCEPVDDTDDDEADTYLPPCVWPGDTGDALHMHTTTGNVWTAVPILRTYAMNAPELNLVARYDSMRADQDGPLGYGWTHSYNMFIERVENGGSLVSAIYHDGTGRRHHFTDYDNGSFTSPAGRSLSLSYDAPAGKFTLTHADGTEDLFNTSDQIEERVDRRGRKTRFTYNSGLLTSILSPHGREVTIAYNGNNRIESVTAPDSTVTDIGYDATVSGELAYIEDPLNHRREFDYDALHRMTQETLRNGTTYSATYTSTTRTLYAYDSATSQDVQIARLECATGFPDDRTEAITPSPITYTDGASQIWTLTRDVLGRLTGVVARNNYGRAYYYGLADSGSRENRLIGIENEAGDLREFDYDSDGNMTVRIDEAGHTEEFAYAGPFDSQLTSYTEADDDEWVYSYLSSDGANGKKGDLVEVIDPLEEEGTDATISYVYQTYGDTEDRPQGVAVDLPGRIKTITLTDRRGNTTVYAYSGYGNLTSITRAVTSEPDLETSYTYDAMGRPTSKTVERGTDDPTTVWDYDDAGRLESVTRDMGVASDLVTNYTYDEYGNLTWIEDPNGIFTKYEYDYRNRLVKMIADPDTATPSYDGLNLVTEWELDGNGNVLSVTDPADDVTTYTYNAQNFLESVTDAEDYETIFTVTPTGLVEKIERQVDAAGTRWYTEAFVNDAIGRPTEHTIDPGEDPHLAIKTLIQYADTSGCGSCSTPGTWKPTQVTDPEENITYFVYDELDRLTEITAHVDGGSGDAVTFFSYDPNGNLTLLVGPEGERVAFDYDEANRRIATRVYDTWDPVTASGTCLEFTYTYDGAGNVETYSRPDGQTVELIYDLANRLTEAYDALSPSDPIVQLTYDANGNVLTRTSALQDPSQQYIQTWGYAYDALGRVLRVDDPTDEDTTFEYDDANRWVERTNRKGIATRKFFDALGRLTQVVRNYDDGTHDGGDASDEDVVTDYVYDGVRMIAMDDPAAESTVYTYDDALRLATIAYPDDGDSLNVVTYTYYDSGNLETRTDQRGIETTYTYDNLYHLTQRDYDDGAGRSEYFDFDKSGRLIEAENDVSRIEHVYDLLGRLTGVDQIYNPDTVDEETYAVDYAYNVATGNTYREITYPTARVVTTQFDARSRPVSVLDDSVNAIGVSNWGYDAVNRRVSASFTNGVASAFTYDLNNRLTSIQHASDVALLPGSADLFDFSFGYDVVGNLLYKKDHIRTDRSEAYAYDDLNRLTLMERGVPNVADPTIIATPIDDARMPWTLDWTDAGGDPTLDQRGNWTSVERTQRVGGNDTTESQARALNPTGNGSANEYYHVAHDDGVAPFTEYLEYDAAGNLVATHLLADMNCDGQLTAADIDGFMLALTNPGTYASTYPDCLAALGDVNGDGVVSAADIDPFVAMITAGASYDLARYFEYDEENRLVSVTVDGVPTEDYLYDALGRRILTHDLVTQLRTRHVYGAGFEVLAEYESSDNWETEDLAREFLWGERFPEPLVLIDWTAAGDVAADSEEVLHYLHDHLGSVIALVDAGDPEAKPEPIPPKVVERYTYDPYGTTYIETWNGSGFDEVEASAYGNPFAWTAQRYDAGVGLYAFPFRSYSPSLGRFLQRDPLGYIDGPNLYEYVRSMPTYYVDPLGLETPPPPGGPPVPVPGHPDRGWRWNPDPRNNRGGSWGPKPPIRGNPGGHPTASWDPEGDGHWDVDDGKGSRQRYDKDGNPLTPDQAHGKEPRPKPNPNSDDDGTEPETDPADPSPCWEPEKQPSADDNGWIIIGGAIIIIVIDIVTLPSGEGIIPGAIILVGGTAGAASGDDTGALVTPVDDSGFPGGGGGRSGGRGASFGW
jgi:RHS repeat-associated protein